MDNIIIVNRDNPIDEAQMAGIILGNQAHYEVQPYYRPIKEIIDLPSDVDKDSELVRIFRANTPLMDNFIKKRQEVKGTVTPESPDNGQQDIDKKWQQFVSAQERNHLIELIGTTIKAYPAPKPTRTWAGEPVLIETTAFRSAGSREDYYRLLAEDMKRVATNLDNGLRLGY